MEFDEKACRKDFDRYEKGLFCVDSFFKGARGQFERDKDEMRKRESSFVKLFRKNARDLGDKIDALEAEVEILSDENSRLRSTVASLSEEA